MRKLFKKSIACCLVLALSLCLFAGAISANALTTNPSYSTEAVTVAPGESTTIKFTVSDFSEIQGVILKVYVPAVVASINSVTADNFTMVQWDDEAGAGNYQIGSDATGKFVKFMELANFTGVDTVAGFTFDINVTVAADAAEGPAAFPAPVIQATDGNELVAINGEFQEFVVQENEPEVPAINATFVANGKSLLFEGIVQIKAYYIFRDIADLTTDYIEENAGLVVWMKGTMPADPAEAVIGTEGSYTVPMVKGSLYNGEQEYAAITRGIPIKEFGDEITYRPYLMVNGEYQYGEIVSYSVRTYCENQLKKDTAGSNLKRAMVAMLNYGASAQERFNYNLDNLANSSVAELAAAGEFPASYITDVELESWDGSYLTDLVAPTDDMTVNFAKSGVIAENGKSCLFEGAISVKYYSTLGSDINRINNVASKKMYFWIGKDYEALKAAGTPLTKENASYSVDMSEYSAYGNLYEASAISEGIVAKELGDTLYAVACVTEADGTEHCTGIITYSPEQYSANQISKNTNPAQAKLCKGMVIYGEFIARYLADRYN